MRRSRLEALEGKGALEADSKLGSRTGTWTLEDVDDGRSPRDFDVALARTRALPIHSEEEKNARGTRHDALELDMALITIHDSSDRKSTRLNSSHSGESRMPSSA